MSESELPVIGSRSPGTYGNGAAQIRLGELTIARAWNAQGDAAHAPFIEAVERAFGVHLPQQPNTVAGGQRGLDALWLGPRSWLLLPGADGREMLQGSASSADISATFDASRDALNAAGGALFDVTASRVAFRIAGAHAPDVLSSHCPLDFHRRAFTPGSVQQSLFGHVNALFLRSDEGDAFTMMVARSFAEDIWQALCSSCARFGYEVVPTAPIGDRQQRRVGG